AGIVPAIKVRAVCKRGALNKRTSVKNLALSLPKHAWRTITWREGTNKRLRSRFARVQVHTALIRGAAERTEETLLIEWPEGEAEPTKYGFQPSTITSRSGVWSISRKCAGGSSAITRNSSRKSGSVTTRGEAGPVSTITRPSALRSTGS